jgi:hypothetical protein
VLQWILAEFMVVCVPQRIVTEFMVVCVLQWILAEFMAAPLSEGNVREEACYWIARMAGRQTQRHLSPNNGEGRAANNLTMNSATALMEPRNSVSLHTTHPER